MYQVAPNASCYLWNTNLIYIYKHSWRRDTQERQTVQPGRILGEQGNDKYILERQWIQNQNRNLKEASMWLTKKPKPITAESEREGEE